MVVTALCLQYDRSDAFASKCIFLNTILSAVTIPLADLAAVLTGAWVLFSLVLCPLTPSCKGNWQPSDWTEGLINPALHRLCIYNPSVKIGDFAHLPLHRGGIAERQCRILLPHIPDRRFSP